MCHPKIKPPKVDFAAGKRRSPEMKLPFNFPITNFLIFSHWHFLFTSYCWKDIQLFWVILLYVDDFLGDRFSIKFIVLYMNVNSSSLSQAAPCESSCLYVRRPVRYGWVHEKREKAQNKTNNTKLIIHKCRRFAYESIAIIFGAFGDLVDTISFFRFSANRLKGCGFRGIKVVLFHWKALWPSTPH